MTDETKTPLDRQNCVTCQASWAEVAELLREKARDEEFLARQERGETRAIHQGRGNGLRYAADAIENRNRAMSRPDCASCQKTEAERLKQYCFKPIETKENEDE